MSFHYERFSFPAARPEELVGEAGLMNGVAVAWIAPNKTLIFICPGHSGGEDDYDY